MRRFLLEFPSRGFLVASILILQVALASNAVAAADPDDARYLQAERDYLKLHHPSTASTRDDWLSVLANLDAIRVGNSAGARSDDALSLSARMSLEMYERFNDVRDLDGAIARTRDLTTVYPASPFAEKAVEEVKRIEGLREASGRGAVRLLVQPAAKPAAGMLVVPAAAPPPATAQAEARRALASAGEEEEEAAENRFAAREGEATAAPPPSAATLPSEPITVKSVRGRKKGEAPAKILQVKPITSPAYTRIVIEASSEVDYSVHRLPPEPETGRPPRLYLDISGAKLSPGSRDPVPVQDGLLEKVRMGQYDADTVRVVLDIRKITSFRTFPMHDPFRIILDVKDEEGGVPAQAQPPSAVAAAPPPPRPPGAARPPLAEVDRSPSEPPGLPVLELPRVEPEDRPVPPPPVLTVPFVEPPAAAPPAPAPDRSSQAPPARQGPPYQMGPLSRELATANSGETGSRPPVAVPASEAPSTPPPPAAIGGVEAGEEPRQEPRAPETAGLEKGNAPEATVEEAGSGGDGSAPHPAEVEKAGGETEGAREAGNGDGEKTDARASEPDRAEKPLAAVPPAMNLASIVGGPKLTLPQQLGLKVRRIVVDPGHGGKDPGARGENGIEEKDIVLAIAKELAGLLRSELRCEVILTREDDTFLALEERTAIANSSAADLFVSIHANAHRSRRVSGIETYFLNFATDSEAMEVAARENATSTRKVSELQLILSDLMRNSKINESSRLASLVHAETIREIRKSWSEVRDHGVKQAPFYVLVDAEMPSILLETSFITNRTEGERLQDPRYQHTLALSTLRGIRRYIEMVETAGGASLLTGVRASAAVP